LTLYMSVMVISGEYTFSWIKVIFPGLVMGKLKQLVLKLIFFIKSGQAETRIQHLMR
jgi:hypothetical protein